MKFHKLLQLTRDVTGQHYRPVPSDVSLPSEEETAEIQAKASSANINFIPKCHKGGFCPSTPSLALIQSSQNT